MLIFQSVEFSLNINLINREDQLKVGSSSLATSSASLGT